MRGTIVWFASTFSVIGTLYGLLFLGHPSVQGSEYATFEETEESTECFTEETTKEPEMWVFESHEALYNPNYVTEEASIGETTEETSTEPEETIAETESAAEVTTYFVCGKEIPYAEYLYNKLSEAGIEWWMPYALATLYQESGCDANARSKDRMDIGLFQYRGIYWEAACEEAGVGFRFITDPYAQIDVYVFQTARRLNEYGYDILSAISAHKRSDFGTYDAKYVEEVTQWLDDIEVRHGED